MARIDSLFELIRSLSKSEKRYFKLFAGMQGKDKKYLLLFDAIDRLEEYDEEILRERFADEKFVRQFSVAKNYLRTMIMKSLRLYHSGGTTLNRLHEMLIDVEILTERGLRKQAERVAAKAEQIAGRFDRFPVELEAVVRRHGFDSEMTMTSEGLQRMATEQRDVLRRLENLVEYGILFYSVARLASRGNEVRTQEQIDELDELMSHPLLQDEAAALSPRAMMRFHWIHAANHFARGSWEGSLRHSLAIIDLIETDPDLLAAHISLYVAAASNALLIYEREVEPDGVQSVMERLRIRARESVMKRKGGSREEARIFTILYSHILTMYANQGEFDEGMTLIPEIERGLASWREVIDETPRMTLHLRLSAICTSAGDFRRGLDFNNQVLQNPEPIEGAGLFRASQLLNLVIHYELGHADLLKHLLPSTERFFRTREAYHRFEQSVVELLETLGSNRSRKDSTATFTRFRDQLLELQNDPLETGPLNFFDYVAWAEAKVQGITIADAIRQRSEERKEG